MHISRSLNNKYSILPRSVAKRTSIEETSLSNFTTIASWRGCKSGSLASRKLAEFWPQPSRCDHATFQKSLHKNIKSICIWNCVGNSISHHLFLFLSFICFFVNIVDCIFKISLCWLVAWCFGTGRSFTCKCCNRSTWQYESCTWQSGRQNRLIRCQKRD